MAEKIKILKASPFYLKYLEKFYNSDKTLKDADYGDQYNVLMSGGFGWADSWKLHLEKTGFYEVFEVISNAEYLQKKWAQENNINYSEQKWLLDILEAQIRKFKPDIFFAHDFVGINGDFRQFIKNKYPDIKLIIGWDGIAKNSAQDFVGCDLMMSCSEDVVSYYQKTGFQTYFLPFGFESSYLNKIQLRNNLYDISFVGSLVIKKNKHNKRLNFLSEMDKRFNIDLWLSALPQNPYFSRTYLDLLISSRFGDLYSLMKLSNKNKGEIFGLDMLQVFSNSKISLNTHVDASNKKAGNVRLFESTGVGSCLVTDWKSNLSDFFELDREVVVYKSLPEAIDKIKFLLNNDLEREKIAQAGKQRTMNDHLMSKRLNDFSDFIISKYFY